MPQYMSALVLLGTERHRLLTSIAVGEAVANLFLSIFLVRRIGVIGVAWGTAIPHIIVTAAVLPYCALRAVGMRATDYVRDTYLRPVLCAVPTGVVCHYVAKYNPASTWMKLGTDLLALCTVFGALCYLICLDRDERAALRQSVMRIVGRLRGFRDKPAQATTV